MYQFLFYDFIQTINYQNFKVKPKKLQKRNLNLLSKVGKKEYSRLNEETFNEIKVKIFEKIQVETHNPSFEDNEKKWNDEHSSYIHQFISKLHQKSVSQRSLDLYQFIIEFYLDECLSYFGKHVQYVNEIDILNLLFDRYIRKVPLPKKEIIPSLKAIYQFYKFLNEIKVIDAELLNFVHLLSKYKDFFDQRVKKNHQLDFFGM